MIELELFVCTVTNSVLMDYCGENFLQTVRTPFVLQPITWPLVKRLFISPPLWSICYRPYFKFVCVCVIPQSHSLVVAWRFLRGKSQPRAQSRLIVPHNHTTHSYRDIQTLFCVVLLVRERRGGLILIAVCGSLERGQDYWGLLVDPQRC